MHNIFMIEQIWRYGLWSCFPSLIIQEVCFSALANKLYFLQNVPDSQKEYNQHVDYVQRRFAIKKSKSPQSRIVWQNSWLLVLINQHEELLCWKVENIKVGRWFEMGVKIIDIHLSLKKVVLLHVPLSAPLDV